MIKTTLNNYQVSKGKFAGLISPDRSVPEAKVLPVCHRCAQVPKNGLYDGFRVKGMFFCSDCQRELFTAEQDSPEYHEFLFLIQGTIFNDKPQ